MGNKDKKTVFESLEKILRHSQLNFAFSSVLPNVFKQFMTFISTAPLSLLICRFL